MINSNEVVLGHWAVFALVIGLAFAVPHGSHATKGDPNAADSANVVFPEAQGSNLEGREFKLPQDFEGDLNLVFVAFQREQQALVDTWVPAAKRLSARYEGLRYYELPTIYKANAMVRWFINSGMRRGIPDQTARETTITLYLDKESFRSALKIPHEDTIYVLLVDAEGRVVWRTEGAHASGKEMDLEGVVSKTLPVSNL